MKNYINKNLFASQKIPSFIMEFQIEVEDAFRGDKIHERISDIAFVLLFLQTINNSLQKNLKRTLKSIGR